MSRPIVHIGCHKTATTWFQLVYYPLVRNLRYVDRLLVKQAFLGHSGFDFTPEQARQELQLSRADEPIILCEEELSGHLHNGVSTAFCRSRWLVGSAGPSRTRVPSSRTSPSDWS